MAQIEMDAAPSDRLLSRKPKHPKRFTAVVFVCCTVSAGLGGAIFMLTHGDVHPSSQHFNRTMYTNGSWVEVHRVSPICLTAGTSTASTISK